MRTGADRLRHAVGFEVMGLLLSVPLFGWLMAQPLWHFGPLALAIALTAMLWNVVYNTFTDWLLLRCCGRLEKRPRERVVHAVGFESGLLVLTLPLTAWWLGISLWQALMLDLGISLFYLVYAFFYNWGYDLLFPVGMPVSVNRA